jgi:hypothetical protein
MARSFGRLFATLWDDRDFRPLSVGAKVMYGFLISQADLEQSGIIGWRPARWARDLGEPIGDVIAWCKELDQGRYVVIDEEVVELLVRSLVRRDEIWRQPNVFKAAATSAKASKSDAIKAALYDEIRRLELAKTGRETQAIAGDLLTYLEPFANPSPNPPEGFPKGSGDPSGTDDGSHGEPSANPPQGGAGRPNQRVSVDNSGRFGEPAGPNRSGTLREAPANHSDCPTEKGKGNGPVVGGAFPLTLTPSPRPQREPSRPLWPAAVPDARTGEGEDSQDGKTPDLPGLIAAIRAIRQDWSTQSIERVLASQPVRERPWPLVCAAALAVARDPASGQPGRLAHDGPWWRQRSAEPAPAPRPGWCGQCDERTRLTGADNPGRCPNCHPLTQARPA